MRMPTSSVLLKLSWTCYFSVFFFFFFGKRKDDGPKGPYNVNHLSHFWKTYIICKQHWFVPKISCSHNVYCYFYHVITFSFWKCCTKGKHKTHQLMKTQDKIKLTCWWSIMPFPLFKGGFLGFYITNFVKNWLSPCWHVSINLKRCHFWKALFRGKEDTSLKYKRKETTHSKYVSFPHFSRSALIFFSSLLHGCQTYSEI